GGVRGSQRILIVAVGGVGVKSILDGVVPKICGSANRGDRDIAHGTIGEHNLAGGHIGVAVGVVVADAKEVLGGSRILTSQNDIAVLIDIVGDVLAHVVGGQRGNIHVRDL